MGPKKGKRTKWEETEEAKDEEDAQEEEKPPKEETGAQIVRNLLDRERISTPHPNTPFVRWAEWTCNHCEETYYPARKLRNHHEARLRHHQPHREALREEARLWPRLRLRGGGANHLQAARRPALGGRRDPAAGEGSPGLRIQRPRRLELGARPFLWPPALCPSGRTACLPALLSPVCARTLAS